jgi:hypothetical protein
VNNTDHYAEAERWLQRQRKYRYERDDETRPPTPEEIALAQAHATLALADVAGKLLVELAALRQHLSGS